MWSFRELKLFCWVLVGQGEGVLQEDLELSVVLEGVSLLEGSQAHKDEGNRCRPIVPTLGRWDGGSGVQGHP